MSDQIADVIDATADAIETYGWIQGRFGSTEKGFCVLGALKFVVFVLEEDYLLHDRAQVAIQGHIGMHVPPWNDADGRTQQQVLDELRLIAKEERS